MALRESNQFWFIVASMDSTDNSTGGTGVVPSPDVSFSLLALRLPALISAMGLPPEARQSAVHDAAILIIVFGCLYSGLTLAAAGLVVIQVLTWPFRGWIWRC